ncbi:acetylcholinesterase-1-like [Ornithodoros turicata]|uniref:acetylcholinesterase-1-like n=1 Tax=Ornithodoros turicata TaxID=34597 RepID=UPI00313930D2
MLQLRCKCKMNILLLLAVALASYELCLAAEAPVANTTTGKFVGLLLNVYGQKVHAFLGVPYARPPVGDRRFAKPVPALPWKTVRSATAYGSRCPQDPSDTHEYDTISDPSMREDCLTLNVWTPPRANESVANKSVMVWLHGGGFKKGHSGEEFYDGSILSATQDVVVVTLNYRLGYLGFLNALHPNASGNVGLYDQLSALNWIKENIKVFGGNSSSVTLFGKGAGATAIALHLLSPHGFGLFQRAILQSADLELSKYVDNIKTAMEKADALAVELGCSRRGHSLLTATEDVLECMRSRDPREILRAQSDLQHKVGPALPSFGTDFLPQDPTAVLNSAESPAVDLLMGHNAEKGKEVLSNLFPSILESSSQNITLQDIEIMFHVLANTYGYSRTIAEKSLEFYLRGVDSCIPQALIDAAIRYSTDLATCASVSLAEVFASTGRSVFYYQSTYTSESRQKWGVSVDTFGSCFAFGAPFRFPGRFNDVDRSFSHVVMHTFAYFAKHGRAPMLNGLAWMKFMESQPNYFEFDPYMMRPRNLDTSGCKLLGKFM